MSAEAIPTTFLTRILESSGEGFALLDHQGLVTYVNSEGLRILGMSRGETVGTSTRHPGWRERVRAADGQPITEKNSLIERVYRSGAHIRNEERTLLRSDGREVFLSVSAEPLRDNEGAIRQVYLSFRDITGQREIEHALRRQMELYQKLLQAQSDLGLGVVVTAGDNCVYVNEHYCRMTGYRREELVGRNVLELLSPPEIARLPCAFHTTLLTRDGHRLEIEAATKTIESRGQTHYVSLVRDVTDRRLNEAALQKAYAEMETRVAERTRDLEDANQRLTELDRLKSEFLAIMSHELRTPLNSILGFTSLMIDEPEDVLTVEQRRNLRIVYESAEHLLVLINDILDVSKIESGTMALALEAMRVGDLLSQVVETFEPTAARRGLSLTLEDRSDHRELESDRRRVIQVLNNLLGNALKFTREGGVSVRCEDAEDAVWITVQDTGIGIREEDLSVLFQPFRQIDSTIQRQYGGAGLGLYLCRKLVALLGGEIVVESRAGEGTAFRFSLPRQHPTPPASPGRAHRLGGERVAPPA